MRNVIDNAIRILVIVSVFGESRAALAQAAAWQIEPVLQLAGISRLQRGAPGPADAWSVAAAAELRLRPPGRLWHVTLVADYVVRLGDAGLRSAGVGSYLRLDVGRWDATTLAVLRRSSGNARAWWYAGRLRYRLADRHKAGVEIKGAFTTSRAPALRLGYYASVSDAVSLHVIAGPLGHSHAAPGAQIELVLQFR